MDVIFTPKNIAKFICEKCDFKCCKQTDWNRHLLTRKHIKTDFLLTNTDNFTQFNSKTFICSCGKSYKHRQSLFNHKKNLKQLPESTQPE